LGSGSVGFGLALVMRVGVSVFGSALGGEAWLLFVIFVRLGRVAEKFCVVIAGAFVRNAMLRFADGFFMMFGCVAERFTGEKLDGVHVDGRDSRRHVGCLVTMAVIVVFEIFENVTDVEEGIAIQADIHESGLHARKDAGYFSFVDAADESEFFFAFDVNLD
jgi:hypothetical protein